MADEVKHPTVLIVIDGFGVAPPGEGNAVMLAKKPNFDRYIRMFPTMTLRASGEEVGLSWGEMGNSEVGHLAIGAGRVYYQMFSRINTAIANGSFQTNEAFLNAIAHAKKNKSRLHLVGIMSPGKIHGMDEHCFELLKLAKEQGLNDVFVHAILDGRDTVLNSALDFIGKLQTVMTELGVGQIATMAGRYFSMDRDNRWDRIEKGYNAMVLAKGPTAEDPIKALQESYKKEVFDEQFVPTVMAKNGKPIASIAEKDAIIFYNFRPDRMRELVQAFALPTFSAFERTLPADLCLVTMAEFEKGLPVQIAYPPTVVENCLAEVLSKKGMKQLHIAETEKYAHVTFFMNGTREEAFAGEDRVIIPSPKVASYDEKPEMSARLITDRVVKELQTNAYDFYILNFANPDMVGHTGNLEATVKAVQVVDECLGKIVDEVLARDGHVFITADHGNAEEKKNLRTGALLKEHATNPVPFVLIGKEMEGQPSIAGEVPDGDLSLMPPIGMLADVAPTILSVIGIEKPEEMEGEALL